MNSVYAYILISAGVSFLIRALPLTLIRRKIRNPFLVSFLYYVPYVTLAVMTFPAIINAPEQPLAGVLALVIGIAAAWKGLSMIGIAGICCAVVFLCELIL